MKNTGDGRRVARVEREIQQTVAQYLLHGIKDRLPGLVTVAHVKMPADLRTAKVFISVLGTDQEKDMVLEILQRNARDIQSYISDNLRMRYCPKLSFYPDTTTESVLKVEKILAELKEKQKTGETDDDSMQEPDEPTAGQLNDEE
jgi:ribosome-binding factor A